MPKKPGFGEGLRAVAGAFAFLQRDAGMWPVAVVPALVFGVLVTLGTVGSGLLATPWLIEWLGLSDPSTWYAAVGKGVAVILTWLMAGILGWFFAFALTPALSSPALERLVAAQETALGVPGRAELGWFRELLCGLRAQIFALCAAVPVLIVLWLIALLVPPLALFTTPLQWLVVALALAWNLLDIPLTLRGVSAADRLGLMADHLPAVLGFGAAFSALFWIPCFGILMLPVGAVAATRLVWRILESSPAALPDVPRPPRLGSGE